MIETEATAEADDKRDGPHYLPSLEEIARMTAEIRSTWSEAEYRRRAGLPEFVAWRVPRVGVGE